jgi:hypothetical protein
MKGPKLTAAQRARILGDPEPEAGAHRGAETQRSAVARFMRENIRYLWRCSGHITNRRRWTADHFNVMVEAQTIEEVIAKVEIAFPKGSRLERIEPMPGFVVLLDSAPSASPCESSVEAGR